MNLSDRVRVARNLVWEASTYQDILEYLSYDLHETPSRINQNEGLFFIWRALMGLHILTLNKLVREGGAFSLQKLINVAGATIKDFDRVAHQTELDSILEDYSEHRLDVVRDRFIAHLDTSSDEIGTDTHMLCTIANQATALFSELANALGFEEYEHDDRCVRAIRSVFSELDQHEKMKALIVAAQIQGRRSIDIAEFIEIHES